MKQIKNILVVEDDRALSRGICLALATPEISLTPCFDLSAARQCCARQDYDLLILDVNLPDGAGLDLLCELRKTKATPIIILTANDLETDEVTGLELGASDYITKPFSLAVLRARVNAQLRRPAEAHTCFSLDDFVFDFARMEYTKAGAGLDLSKTEQRLLRYLVENRGQTLTRDLLISRVWTDGAEFVEENALSVTIKRLRDKIEDDPSRPRYIRTVYGVGYTWAVNS